MDIFKFFRSLMEHRNGLTNHYSAIHKMIDLRRQVDNILKHENKASEWTLSKIAETPELLITNLVEFYEFLRDDGHSEKESIKKLAEFAEQRLPDDGDINLHSYIKLRIEACHPSYLEFGLDLLNRAVIIATAYAKNFIEKHKQEKQLFSLEWLREKIPHDKISAHRNQLYATNFDGTKQIIEASVPGSREYVRFRLRVKPDDEVWSFSGFFVPGSGRGFCAGIALVRYGIPIESIVTIRG